MASKKEYSKMLYKIKCSIIFFVQLRKQANSGGLYHSKHHSNIAFHLINVGESSPYT